MWQRSMGGENQIGTSVTQYPACFDSAVHTLQQQTNSPVCIITVDGCVLSETSL